MRDRIRFERKKWITYFDKKIERTIFFYATIITLLIGVYFKFFGGG